MQVRELGPRLWGLVQRLPTQYCHHLAAWPNIAGMISYDQTAPLDDDTYIPFGATYLSFLDIMHTFSMPHNVEDFVLSTVGVLLIELVDMFLEAFPGRFTPVLI